MLMVPVRTTLVNFFLYLFRAHRRRVPRGEIQLVVLTWLPETAFRESPWQMHAFSGKSVRAREHAGRAAARSRNVRCVKRQSREWDERRDAATRSYEFLKLTHSLVASGIRLEQCAARRRVSRRVELIYRYHARHNTAAWRGTFLGLRTWSRWCVS